MGRWSQRDEADALPPGYCPRCMAGTYPDQPRLRSLPSDFSYLLDNLALAGTLHDKQARAKSLQSSPPMSRYHMEMEDKVAWARQCSTQRPSISGVSISETPIPRHGANVACHTTWRRQQSTTRSEHWWPELAEHHINVNIINLGWIET